MKVFVTGATGYIGFAVASALARHGHEVLGLTRDAKKGQRLAAAGIEPVVGNLDAPQAWLAAARECAATVHCGAEFSDRFFSLDRSAVAATLESARATGLPRLFVYTSGVWEMGDTGDRVVDESCPSSPPPALAARAETARFVLAANAGNLRTLVVRPGCVYGGSGSLTATWFSTAAKDGAAAVIGDGRQRWAMIHLDDLSDLYVRAVESPLGGHAFNATDRSRATVRECAEAASRAAGRGGSVRLVPVAEAAKTWGFMAECMAMTQHVDSSKAARLLGWQPRHGGFADGVRRYHLAWKASQAP